jgi:hypothetical protein
MYIKASNRPSFQTLKSYAAISFMHHTWELVSSGVLTGLSVYLHKNVNFSIHLYQTLTPQLTVKWYATVTHGQLDCA